MTTSQTTDPQTQNSAAELAAVLSDIKETRDRFKGLETETATLKQHINELRRLTVVPGTPSRVRPRGSVSDACARQIAAQFIAHCERSGKLEALASCGVQRDTLTAFARDELNVATRAALTTGNVPLPTQYSGEIRELVSEFGVARRKMMPYPIGMGTARPARMGARPSFGSIAMSAAFTEKSPTLTFASLESHKIGGIVRVPREIDEQSVVAMGHFLARYGAIEFARAEDTWGFLADGTGAFENVKGIVQIARDNSKTQALPSTKTKPSDATLADFRAVRTKVNKAALNGRLSAYYLDSTWEAQLPSFRTSAEPNVYQRLPDGTALLDGYPIVWTDVLTAYGTTAAADQPIAVFGALSFWWMGEHGQPRMDTSEHVYFANDQLAVRFIEEIDFDYAAADATAALLTAAS
ncbi:MAG TPA: phage major capsid protein [Verrucomicrobiae bacterium]|nr:phage major capsid protein [Verrucomicrobiae bacterium]